MKKKVTIILFGMTVLFSACSIEMPEWNKQDEKPPEQNPVQEEPEPEPAEISLPDSPLQKGDRSEKVEHLQHVLKEIGYPVEETGTFDELTTWALTDIQLQQDKLDATGLYDDATQKAIKAIRAEEKTIKIGKGLKQPAHPDEFPDTIENPYDVLAVVNKSYALPGDYEPNDLVVPEIRFPFESDDPKKQLRKVAADALEELFAAGDAAGVTLYAQSGYRSFDRQEAVFASYVQTHGEKQANTYSAKPGESEHQTGLVMDVTSEAIGFGINLDFAETKESDWLKAHAHEYGFIIRYPQDKVDITKYQYEPWHIRYVGKKAAKEIYENKKTLEEYFGVE